MPSDRSLSIEIIEDLVSLFVCDHTLVGALHLIKENDIDIGLGALSETGRDHQAVEKVGIALDILKFVRGSGRDEISPEAGVLRRHILF